MTARTHYLYLVLGGVACTCGQTGDGPTMARHALDVKR